LWLHSLKVAQLLRSAACLHTTQSRSYLNHLVFVRGIHSATEVHEEVASLRSLKGITTGEDLFRRRREALTPSKL